MSVEDRIAELGYNLGDPPQPLGQYVRCVVANGLAFTAGHGPFDEFGNVSMRGQVGSDLTLEQGRQAARLSVVACLASLKSALGSLDQVEQIGDREGPDVRHQHEIAVPRQRRGIVAETLEDDAAGAGRENANRVAFAQSEPGSLLGREQRLLSQAASHPVPHPGPAGRPGMHDPGFSSTPSGGGLRLRAPGACRGSRRPVRGVALKPYARTCR